MNSIETRQRVHLPQISVVLPFTLNERIGPSGIEWRHKSDEHAWLRLELLLSSFRTFFRQEDLDTFLIVCPAQDVETVTTFVKRLQVDPRYVVVSERVLCPNIPWGDYSARANDGWLIQQILKLAVAEYLSAEFYLTLDSDIVCLRAMDYHSLISDNKAIAGIETSEDYVALYQDWFVTEEILIKSRRYDSSARLLRYTRSLLDRGRYYSETPCLLHRETVLQMLQRIEDNEDAPWATVLANTLGWTEYGLYFQYLEQHGTLTHVHRFGNRDEMLDLSHSVWHVPARYRETRRYDPSYFVKLFNRPNGGRFLALQSWLGITSWLPEWATSSEELYHLLSNEIQRTHKAEGKHDADCYSDKHL